jgi:hypothetical protein
LTPRRSPSLDLSLGGFGAVNSSLVHMLRDKHVPRSKRLVHRGTHLLRQLALRCFHCAIPLSLEGGELGAEGTEALRELPFAKRSFYGLGSLSCHTAIGNASLDALVVRPPPHEHDERHVTHRRN